MREHSVVKWRCSTNLMIDLLDSLMGFSALKKNDAGEQPQVHSHPRRTTHSGDRHSKPVTIASRTSDASGPIVRAATFSGSDVTRRYILD